MKQKIKKGMTRFMAGVAVWMLLLTAAPLRLDAGACEGAFQSCMVDAAITTLFGGPAAGGAWAAGCGIGYAWCLRYL